MTETRFKLSFTSLPLGLREAEVVVPLWLESQDWEQVYRVVSDQNLLQKGASTSTVRIFREIRQRLETLDPETLEDFMDSGVVDRKAILLLAACKCYPILFRFIREVMWEKTLVFDYSLEAVDFEKFWNRLAEEDETLENITDSTRTKVRQVTFRILFEAGLLSSTLDALITPIHISTRMNGVVAREGAHFREAFSPA
jgi:hypothetical protein